MTRYALLEYPPPTLEGQPACTSCAGRGITGERYTMGSGEDRPPLLLDVFCPDCGGCGQQDHTRCTFFSPCAETLDRRDEFPEVDDDDEDLCPSCSGRQWWAAQGFAGEGEETVMYHLRVPCGCTDARVQYVER